MISYVLVDGFTRVVRQEAIERLKRAIAAADGVIVDFAFFGLESIRLTVEVEAGSLMVFREGLEHAGIELLAASASELDAAKTMSPAHRILALLHVSFLSAREADAEPVHAP